ncbi:hypothetical protein PHJA_002664600 [Phtheirospermum japonicum]|uniref:Uncharacterized protein n=1 Tax=Phtheirospermum japonicum TaxID=374723 RepID=A0A830D9B5_9LAMI|nr:hypothetical protein PHJA_002664600 [Phtheirospermum japonicum]
MHPAADNSHAAAPRRQIAPRPQIRSFQWCATREPSPRAHWIWSTPSRIGGI